MKKELIIHFSSLIFFFLLISLFRKWFQISFWPFWVGGLIGTLLPDVDHLVYSLYLRPHETTSQAIGTMLKRGEILETAQLLGDMVSERKGLIFHSAGFQILFLIMTFLVITSSGSLLGRGLVLAYLTHLLVDQFLDLYRFKSLGSWFKGMNISLDREKTIFYWLAQALILFFLAFIF